MLAHLLLTLHLVRTQPEKRRITRGSKGNAADYIQKPGDVAQNSNDGHRVMYAFYSWMLDACAQNVEVLAESNISHDIKIEEHGPSRNIKRLAQVCIYLRDQEIHFGLDARLICREGYRTWFMLTGGF